MTARVALVGAPGAGKSSVAVELAAGWACTVLDTDALYAQATGRSVADAVIDDESGFRKAERDIVLAALTEPGAVIAVGSGALADPAVREALLGVRVVWLEVGLVDAARRTGLSGARPLSLGNVRGQLHEMLKARAEVYRSVADYTLNTDRKQAAEVAERIVEWEATA